MDELMRQAETVVKYCGEVNRRLSEDGIEGVKGVLSLFHQMKNSLAKVKAEELEWATAEIRRVMEALAAASSDLRLLKMLKQSVENVQ